MTQPPLQLLTEWARLLLDAFAQAGVTDVVVSPGSRSTPFVLAAARHPGLVVTDVVDERSAGFFALGQARVTGRPSLLVCTSGTAGAHYYPAVIEASAAGVPMLLLTADRPFELQDCGAPQTIDQLRLFGEHVRRFVELGPPEPGELAMRALRRRAAQSVLEATWPRPGPVHLNARARKPLEPELAHDASERTAAAFARTLLGTATAKVYVPSSAPTPAALESLQAACDGARRGLLVAGPGPLTQGLAREDVFALARATGFALACDATSQLRFGGAPEGVTLLDAPDVLLASPRLRSERFDLVFQLGAPPTSGAWESFLAAQAPATHVVVAPHGWNDFTSRADLVVLASVGESARALAALVTPPSADRARFARRLARANTAVWEALDQVFAATEGLSEAEAARTVVAKVPAAGLLVVGNSLPIRLVDASCPASLGRCPVLSQRGANGIDGLVSGAAGAASTGRATVLLVGDVSFLHDLGGLAVAREARTPLVLVVLQNGGGRIFEQLPVARAGLAADELAHFTTPHPLHFAGAAELFGLPYRSVDARAGLDLALDEALSHMGASLIEVVVPAHGAAELRARLAATAERLIDAALTEAT